VELVGGQKLTAKMVILGDGVHSKTAQKYHKMPLTQVDVGGWRYVLLTTLVNPCVVSHLCVGLGILHLRDVLHCYSSHPQI